MVTACKWGRVANAEACKVQSFMMMIGQIGNKVNIYKIKGHKVNTRI